MHKLIPCNNEEVFVAAMKVEQVVDEIGELCKDIDIKTLMTACYSIADTLNGKMQPNKSVIHMDEMCDIPLTLRRMAHAIENDEYPKQSCATLVYGKEIIHMGERGKDQHIAVANALFDLNAGIARITNAALGEDNE